MAAFRILDQSPVYFLLDGVTPAANGRIEFYEAGTTTSKDVYADAGLISNNGSSVALGSDGRTTVDVWGDGSYRVRVYASDDTLISDDDNVEIPGGDGAVIPALEAGKVLSNDGAVLEWVALEETPDPTGQSGKILGSDGTSYVWQDAPTAPDVPLAVGASSFQAGSTNGKAFYVQRGTATAPASGTFTTSKAIVFPKVFAEVWYADASVETVEPGGPIVAYKTSPATTGGFTPVFDVAEGANANNTIASDIPFSWIAFGLVNVT